MALINSYDRRARLTPGLLAIAPVTFAVATLGLKRFPAIAVAAGVLTAAGGGYLLSVLVAHFGRVAQQKLWQSWSGRPTTHLLRTRETASNVTQRDIWRQAIVEITGVALLTPRREASNPQAADDAIEAAVDQVRFLGQDQRFPMVALENAQYGFERNMYGFRWLGRSVAALSTVTLAITLFVAQPAHPKGLSTGALVAGILVDAAFGIGWILIPSAKRTEAAGYRYANQLLQAVVNLKRSGPPPEQSRARG